ncbi:MAG: hypothetical protein K0R14_719 [Burkholderiales bacterium]|nr:hypothetical protein [Burkholderiales bacterium]
MKKIILILAATISFNSWADTASDVTDVACSEEVKGFADFGIDMVAEGFAEELPFFGPVAGLLAGSLKNAACPDTTEAKLEAMDKKIEGLSKRMDAMDEKINEIAVGMKNMGFDIQNELSADITEVYYNMYMNNQKTFNSYVKAYENLLVYTKPDGTRVVYSSLKELVQNYPGGFRALWNKSPLFQTALTSTADLVKMMTDIMPVDTNAPSIMKELNAMCRDETKMSDDVDVVTQRVKCNSMILDISLKTDAYALKTRGILTDYIETILAATAPNAPGGAINLADYPDLQSFNDDSSIPYVDPKLDKDHQPSGAALLKVTNDYIASVKAVFVGKTNKNENMFMLYQGLPPELVQNVANVCKDPISKEPGISHWYPNFVSGDPGYIITTCPTRALLPAAGQKNVIPTADTKIYYSTIGKWNNILGALVDANGNQSKLDNSGGGYDIVSIGAPHEISGSIDNTSAPWLFEYKATMTSNVPLDINSMVGTTIDNANKITVQNNMTFIQSGQYASIYPAFFVDGSDPIAYAPANLINKPQQILAPHVNTDGTRSSTVFDTDVFVPRSQVDKDGNRTPSYIYENTIYMSFKDDSGITHPFGLIVETEGYGLAVMPVCFDDKDCMVKRNWGVDGIRIITLDPNYDYTSSSIQWNNGPSVRIIPPGEDNDGSQWSLKVDTKVNSPQQ